MLTAKQHELIRFIQQKLEETGISPSFEEMKEALDLKSKSGVHRLISALEDRGRGWRRRCHDDVVLIVMSCARMKRQYQRAKRLRMRRIDRRGASSFTRASKDFRCVRTLRLCGNGGFIGGGNGRSRQDGRRRQGTQIEDDRPDATPMHPRLCQ